ncbi:hypothetical protein T439DRAFT_127245 [Meredithblackwellia eburnea MCA 4105]
MKRQKLEFFSHCIVQRSQHLQNSLQHFKVSLPPQPSSPLSLKPTSGSVTSLEPWADRIQTILRGGKHRGAFVPLPYWTAASLPLSGAQIAELLAARARS